MKGMLDVVARFAKNLEHQDVIEKEMGLYMSAGGLFGRDGAIRARDKMQPGSYS